MDARQETRHSRLPRPSSRASHRAADAVLIIFAKAPIPGQVKTRLCPPLTTDEAASLHGSFVLDMLERSGRAGKAKAGGKNAALLDRVVACAPSSDHVFFKVVEERQGVRLVDQIGADLGARMNQAFETVFALGYRRALLVGTDLPTLPESSFAQALTLLDHHDVVLGPSLDGGYVLIGLSRPAPALFTGIPWSTDQVCALTRKKADDLGLTTVLLPASRDIDTIHDLRVLIKEAGLEVRGNRPNTRPSIVSSRTAGVLRLLADRYPERLSVDSGNGGEGG